MRKENYDNGFIYLTESANKGHELAVKLLMHLYINEINKKQDHSKTVSYYENTASNTNSFSINYLGWMYLNGIHYEKNVEKAIMYFKKGKKLNCGVSIHNLGWIHYNSNIKKDYQKALKYFKKAIKAGHIYSYKEIGDIYYNGGYTFSEDHEKALKYYSKLKNNHYCVFQIGVIYCCGGKLPQNMEKAIEYFEKAASLGSSAAIISLASIYYYGWYNTNVNYKKAFELCEKLPTNSEAIYITARMYYYGRGVSQDIEKAIELYSKIKELNNFVIAFLDNNNYYNTDPENYKKALSTCNYESQNIIHLLNKILIDGKGSKQDRSLAKEILRKLNLEKFIYVPEKLKKYKDIRIQYEKDVDALRKS